MMIMMLLPQRFPLLERPSFRKPWLLLLSIVIILGCCVISIDSVNPHHSSRTNQPLAFVTPSSHQGRRHYCSQPLTECILKPQSNRRNNVHEWKLHESTESTNPTTIIAPTNSRDQHLPPPQSPAPESQGLYRSFAEYTWKKLKSYESNNNNNHSTASFVDFDDPVPDELRSNVAPAKGFPVGSTVSMETRAIRSKTPNSLFRYARFALLETAVASPITIPTSSDPNDHSNGATSTTTTTTTTATTTPEHSSPSSSMSSTGIHVLNFVIVPHSNLPVWGVDLVSLPGDKHLMLMDAQPVHPKELSSSSSSTRYFTDHWKDWHERHVLQNRDVFPWGGDIPLEAAQYVSSHALWTRLPPKQSPDQVRAVVQGPLWEAFCEHLDMYLNCLHQQQQQEQQEEAVSTTEDDSVTDFAPYDAYLQYRKANDPARPMLRALYGPEWTERVLHEVLFPML